MHLFTIAVVGFVHIMIHTFHVHTEYPDSKISMQYSQINPVTNIYCEHALLVRVFDIHSKMQLYVILAKLGSNTFLVD